MLYCSGWRACCLFWTTPSGGSRNCMYHSYTILHCTILYYLAILYYAMPYYAMQQKHHKWYPKRIITAQLLFLSVSTTLRHLPPTARAAHGSPAAVATNDACIKVTNINELQEFPSDSYSDGLTCQQKTASIKRRSNHVTTTQAVGKGVRL